MHFVTVLSPLSPNYVSLQGGGPSLHDVGAVCISDRHSQVIQQQKQTIRELRKKMTEMREANPPSELGVMRRFQIQVHNYIVFLT